jgi:hypothetical protein
VIEQLSLIFSDTQNRMGELIIDGFLSETYEFCNELTTHPVESGYSFVDHIHNKPISLQLEGVISNTPYEFYWCCKLLNLALILLMAKAMIY